MIVRICEVKIVACYARAETLTEAFASVGSMVATPLDGRCYMVRGPLYACNGKLAYHCVHCCCMHMVWSIFK